MALLTQSQAEYYNDQDYGNYQFTSLKDLVNQFMIGYVGDNKLISRVNKTDVIFHAKRALQELSFDVFKSCKAQEYDIPSNLTMPLPQDYVNYTKISWVDSAGIKHRLYPTLCKTGNPDRYQQDANGDFNFTSVLEGPGDGNLINTGDLLNTTLEGGTQGWCVNCAAKSGVFQGRNAVWGPSNAAAISTSTMWHHYQNKLCLYNGTNFRTIRYTGLPIVDGEKYSLTFTLSNYVAGTYSFFLTDSSGSQVQTINYTADGTYTVEIDMSTATFVTGWTPGTLSFRNDNTGSGSDSVCIDNISLVKVGDEASSTTWDNYRSNTPSENNNNDYEDDVYWPYEGERYGLDPSHAQANGSFFIDCKLGKIHFSSNVAGKTVVLDYISDSLGTDEEMQVHKFAEEAMYKWILYAIISTRFGIAESIVRRYKKEKFAEIRKAKLRLSNIKIEEITQILRGKSKQIKH
tara:strand:- start:7892 stop:9271 length:1380 start_codon:yes stop_codon:yes gene_type:complete